MKIKCSAARLAALLLALVCLSTAVFAQARSASVAGVVMDERGAPVPNVRVTAENESTGQQHEVITDSRGIYRFERMPVARYRITVGAAGTAGQSAQAVDLSSGDAGNVQVRMRSADPAAPPVVEATSTPAGETETAQISKSFNTRRTEYLPQPNFISRDGRAYGAYNLGLTPAGVTAAYGPVVTGQSPTSNNFHIDGIDNNNRVTGEPLVYLSNEATSEFTLFQNKKAGTEFGHAVGGQFNSIVRTGTNAVHGSIYNYLQNRMMNAMDRRYALFGLQDNPRYDQNRLGATIGTPVIPNVMFFFANFEYIPLGFTGSPGDMVTFAPTAAGYNALLGTAGLSRNNINVLSQFAGEAPQATQSLQVAGRTIGFGPIMGTRRNYQNQYVGTGGIDWNFANRDSLHLRYSHNEREGNFNRSTLQGFQSPVNSRSLLASVSHYHTFGAVTNELRAGYTRFDQTTTPSGAVFPGLAAFPNISIASDVNINLGQNAGFVNNPVVNTFHLADNLATNWRGHNLHFGFDGRRTTSRLEGFPASNGIYSYSSIERFLRDLPPDVQSQRAFNASPYNGNQWSLFGYINDRFTARPGVSIDVGLGYQYVTVPRSLRNQSLNAAASVPGVLEFNEPQAQQWNWTPKVGVAISPGLAGGTTFRGGFGIVRDALQNNAYYLPAIPQFGTVSYGNLGSNLPGFLAGGGLPSPGLGNNLTPQQARANTTFYSPGQRLPYSMQWNAGLQQQIWRGMVIEAKYIGARTLDIPVQTRLNSVAGVSVERSLPVYYLVPGFSTLDVLPVTYENLRLGQANSLAQYGFTSPITSFVNDGQSSYHGLALEGRARFAGGFQMLGSYTWSHLIDDVAYGTVQGTGDRSADRADSTFDRRQRAVVSALFEPAALFPNTFSVVRNVIANFSIGGTFSYQSPQRVTPLAGFDANFDGDGANDRAIVNAGASGFGGTGVTGLTNRGGQLVGYLANNPDARFVRTPGGAFASGSRNMMSLGQINNFDVFATKRFAYRERFGFEVRGDAYNLFNHAQYVTDPITDLYGTPGGMASMLIPGTANFRNMERMMSGRPRTLQVALRLTF